ncbi:MAG: DAK2 domain-containing protein [Peptococcaceae bacterium]|nr:DAK2 domain-containing protein [Peptococcaceae bacterium]
MPIYSFNGTDLKMMLRGAVELLERSKEEIDALNVFPVPDGDTGTNMYQSLLAAVNEAGKTDSNHIGLIAEAAARGGLMGARGNSGVILSQVLHGFARSLRQKEEASASDIIEALENGAQTAYRAVMSPVEGTILTVVRRSAEGAAAQRSEDLLRIMVAVLKNAFKALQETPELLPALKQAGVVDAGGKGFVVILQGILQALKSASPVAKAPPAKPADTEKEPRSQNSQDFTVNTRSIHFTYCTELLIKGPALPLEKIKEELMPYGDCLMVVGEENLARVHLHSNHPGIVLECCLKYGTLHGIKINNMAEQHQEMIAGFEKTGSVKPFGIIAVGSGKGITEILRNLGADSVVAGGQTANPSTGEILEAIDEVPAEKIILLPNNKNIILAAEQAAGMSRKKITVIPSKSIPQGISALLTLNPQDDFETAAGKMMEAPASVLTGEITKAVRDTAYKGLTVRQGDFIGLAEGDLKAAGTDLAEVLAVLLENMVKGEGRLITLYCGDALELSRAQELAQTMQERFGGQDFEVQYGGQPVYDLIISVE